MGSSGSGFGSGGFGSQGSMGSGANVGQGFGNIDQSNGFTGRMDTMFEQGIGGVRTQATPNSGNTFGPSGGVSGSKAFGGGGMDFTVVNERGNTGTPFQGRPVSGPGSYGYVPPGYGFPQNNAGTSAAPNYQGGYGGPTAGGGYGPEYEQAMQSTYTPGGFDPGGSGYGYDPTSSPEYAAAMTASGDPGGAMMGDSPQNLMEYINQYRAGVGANAVEGSANTAEEALGLIQQDDLRRQYDQNQSYVNSLPEAQQSNEQTAQSLGYLSYQAYLNANPGQTMPGAAGIPGQQSADPGNTESGQQGYQPGSPYQPSGGYQPSYYNPNGYYDPRTQTAYTGGFGGGPAQQPSPPQRTYAPAATSGGLPPGQQNPFNTPVGGGMVLRGGNLYQTPGMFDAYNQQNGISSQPQGGTNGYIVPGTGHPGENSPGGDIGPIKPPGPGDRVDPPDYEGALNGTNPAKGQIGKPRGSSQPNGKTMPVLKRNGTGTGSSKQRATVNPFEDYDDDGPADFGSGMASGRQANSAAQRQINNGMAPPPGTGGMMPQAMTMMPGATPEQMQNANRFWEQIKNYGNTNGQNSFEGPGDPGNGTGYGGKQPWMGPNPTAPYPEGNMTPEQSAPQGTRPFHPTGNQPIEGGIDMNWLGQDGRFLGGGGAANQGAENYALENNIAPPPGMGGGNPFGAVSRPPMSYPGGGQPQPSGGGWGESPTQNPFETYEGPMMNGQGEQGWSVNGPAPEGTFSPGGSLNASAIPGRNEFHQSDPYQEHMAGLAQQYAHNAGGPPVKPGGAAIAAQAHNQPQVLGDMTQEMGQQLAQGYNPWGFQRSPSGAWGRQMANGAWAIT
jgi:hypothetical protein